MTAWNETKSMQPSRCVQEAGTGTLAAGWWGGYRRASVAPLTRQPFDSPRCSAAWRSHRCVMAARPANLTMANVMNAAALWCGGNATARAPCSVSSPQKLLSYFVSPNTSCQGKSNPSCVSQMKSFFLHSAKRPCSHTPSVYVTGPKLFLKSSICLRIPIYQRIRAHIDHRTTGCHRVIWLLHARAHTPRLDPPDLCEDKGLGAKKDYSFTFDLP